MPTRATPGRSAPPATPGRAAPPCRPMSPTTAITAAPDRRSSNGCLVAPRLLRRRRRAVVGPRSRAHNRRPSVHRAPIHKIWQSFQGLVVRTRPLTLTLLHPDLSSEHFFATLDGLG